MQVRINGKDKEIKNDISVAGLLIDEKVEMPDMVSVQLNGAFLQKENYAATVVRENDEIDFLYFMGGGK